MENEMLLQNPWWRDKTAIDKDEKIEEALGKKPIISYEFLDKSNLIILGPRQVGKTTMLKFFVRNLLQKGINPRNVLYFSCELLKDKNEIITLLTTLEKISPEGQKFVFLDEITTVKNWEHAVKFFLDSPLKKQNTVVVTGSNALFLKHGAERMPGRDVKILLDLPFSFREFLLKFGTQELCSALLPLKLNYGGLSAANVSSACRELISFSPEIEKVFRTYVKTGGFLKAICEYRETGAIKPSTYEIYVNWILGDLNKISKSEFTFRSVMQAIVRNYGNSTSYLSIAKEMEIPSHVTVADYLCDIQDLLLANSLYAGDVAKQIPLARKEKKYYFSDPFLYSAFSGYLNGIYKDYSEENMEKIVEGIVCEALSRLNRQNLDHSSFLWYFRNNKETDFAIKNNGKVTGIEVKWSDKLSKSDFANFFSFKNRILLSKSKFDFQKENNFAMLPVPVFLAML
ncbi:MAG: ATP-binding protein [Candidatus Micrarchaeota archaeon]